eukprot:4468300-Amphidinium_carterae.2
MVSNSRSLIEARDSCLQEVLQTHATQIARNTERELNEHEGTRSSFAATQKAKTQRCFCADDAISIGTALGCDGSWETLRKCYSMPANCSPLSYECFSPLFELSEKWLRGDSRQNQLLHATIEIVG